MLKPNAFNCIGENSKTYVKVYFRQKLVLDEYLCMYVHDMESLVLQLPRQIKTSVIYCARSLHISPDTPTSCGMSSLSVHKLHML